MIKIKGYIIKYKPFDNKSRTTLHHVLFGRLTTVNSRGKKYAHYSAGMLNEIPFIRLMNSKIFVVNINNINTEELRIFGDITVEECERELTIDSLKTGKEYWRDVSKERGLRFNDRK